MVGPMRLARADHQLLENLLQDWRSRPEENNKGETVVE